MFSKTRSGKKIESMASILILGGVLPLCVAVIAQYRFHLPPCHFCLLQRYPYGVAILAGALSLLLVRGSATWAAMVLVGLAAIATSGALGLVHTGIERGWINYESGCVASAAGAESLEALRAQILNAAHVSCSDAMATFMGLSMASWNAVFAFAVAALGIAQYRFDRRRYAAKS